MSPVVLTCVAGLANGTMNILPWGGPTARAATALELGVSDVFVPMIPSLIAGLIVVLVFAWLLGLQERNRLRSTAPEIWASAATVAAATGRPRQLPARGAEAGARATQRTGNLVHRPRRHPPSQCLAHRRPRRRRATPPWPTRCWTPTARPCGPSCIWFNLA